MLTEIITLYPDNTPPTEPPGAARFRIQREREIAAAVTHASLPRMVRGALPAVIPFHLTPDDIARRFAGVRPEFVAVKGIGIVHDLDSMVIEKLKNMAARKPQRRIA